VHQWNYVAGNQPDPQHPTLRAALDAASTKVEIQLLGDDAHHAAFNSLALATDGTPGCRMGRGAFDAAARLKQWGALDQPPGFLATPWVTAKCCTSASAFSTFSAGASPPMVAAILPSFFTTNVVRSVNP
jgi:hypothetical protein